MSSRRMAMASLLDPIDSCLPGLRSKLEKRWAKAIALKNYTYIMVRGKIAHWSNGKGDINRQSAHLKRLGIPFELKKDQPHPMS